MNQLPRDRKALRRYLKAERHQWGIDHPDWSGFAYDGPPDFVLQHGRPYQVELLGSEDWFMPGHCYHNAIGATLQNPGWSYIEGYAMIPLNTQQTADLGQWWAGPEVVQHAWCLTENDEPVEVTWPFVGRAYLGVAFSPVRAEQATWDGDATVLDDFNRGWPLLRERWMGEREWEMNDRCRAFAARDMRKLHQLMEQDL